MAEDEPARDDESLSDTFWATTRRMRHAMGEAVAPLGITGAQARALGVLLRHGPMRLSSLSEHLRIAPRSATEFADALGERGLAERSPDPDDRRATILSLTAEGARTAQALHEARRRAADSVFGTLPPGDRAELARILRSLHDAADAPGEPGGRGAR